MDGRLAAAAATLRIGYYSLFMPKAEVSAYRVGQKVSCCIAGGTFLARRTNDQVFFRVEFRVSRKLT